MKWDALILVLTSETGISEISDITQAVRSYLKRT